jgi:hypothetical protein
MVGDQQMMWPIDGNVTLASGAHHQFTRSLPTINEIK